MLRSPPLPPTALASTRLARLPRQLSRGLPALVWSAAAAILLVQPLSGAMALLAGAGLARFLALPAPGARVASGLLKTSVVLLGLGLDLPSLLRHGVSALLPSGVLVALSLVLARHLGRRLAVPRPTALLLGVGTAICGGAAIAAAGPAIGAHGRDFQRALAVVFLYNALALILFPTLGQALDLDPGAYGRWCALAIHDTSSVVGAAAQGGPHSLELATVGKLARSLWLLPVVILLARRHAPRPGSSSAPFPGFVLAFVAAAALGSTLPESWGHRELGALLSPRLSGVALLGIGALIPMARPGRTALRAGALAAMLWLLISALALAWVLIEPTPESAPQDPTGHGTDRAGDG